MAFTKDKSEIVYIGCECHCPEHIIRVSYFDWMEKDQPEIFIELQADGCMPFWKRLKMGLNFIFRGKNLEWHDVVPTKNDIVTLHRVLDHYLKDYKIYLTSQEKTKDG